MRSHIIALLVSCILAVKVQAEYIVSDAQLSWHDARKECKKANADLVTIDNELENRTLNALLRSRGQDNRYWIGLNCIRSKGNFTWIGDSTLSSFRNWAPNEPNDFRGIEECTEIWAITGFQWNDLSCSTNISYICEKSTKPKPTISTFCLAESFGISIEKNISSFTSVTLKDPSCIGISNATHIILSTSFSECATSKSETKDHIVVSNEVRILGAADGQITRANQTIIPFECRYSRSGLETSLVSFQPKVKSFLQAQESGFGNFTINFEMARNAQFNSYFDTYPVPTEINDRLYFQVSLNTNNTDTALLIESCHATSSMKKNDAIKYTLINNRCPTDSTLQFHFGAMHHKKFSFLAFNFLRNVPTIYMHCGVFLCHKASKDSRCTSGCSINKLPSTRKRRELEKREIPRESSEIYVLDNGPIQKREQSKKDSSLSSVSTIMIVMGLAVGILSLILASVFILKMRKKVLRKSSKQTVDSRGKQGMDNKAMEMENCA